MFWCYYVRNSPNELVEHEFVRNGQIMGEYQSVETTRCPIRNSFWGEKEKARDSLRPIGNANKQAN